jgi:hypothetical protein
MIRLAAGLCRIDCHAAHRVFHGNVDDPDLRILAGSLLFAIWVRAIHKPINALILKAESPRLQSQLVSGFGERNPHIPYHCTFVRGGSMTAVEVLFRYGMPPTENQMGALGLLSDVYGIRRLQFNEKERTIRVEYDATRLNESTVEKLLRNAGFDIREKPVLA